MTQTRTFLIVAWLVVAFLLWDAWQKDQRAVQSAAPTPTQVNQTTASAPDGSVPAVPVVEATPITDEPTPSTPTAPPSALAAGSDQVVVLANDVLRLSLAAGGGAIVEAQLLAYPQVRKDATGPVRLLSREAEQFFVAQNGLVGTPAAPTHEDRMVAQSGDQVLQEGATAVALAFVWQGPDGLEVERRYRLARGSYLVEIEDTVRNQGSSAWSGNAYHQLVRVAPPIPKGGFTNPERLSFVGAAWYSPQDKFEKLKFDKFDPKEPLNRVVTGGWIAMLQHYFVAAIVPAPGEPVSFSNAALPNGRYLMREMGSSLSVQPGTQASTQTSLYLGPKLRSQLEEIAPGLGLSLDYGIFTAIAQPIHWLLALIHSLVGNWGWAIVLLTLAIRGAFFKLSEKQYRSMAKMRKFGPRIKELRERHAGDREQLNRAMMELYKKEKFNPLAGCWPLLLQFPVFIALYYVLIESVEMRQAPFVLWLQDLSSPDPYYLLPIVYGITMWFQQRLSGQMATMDPTQQKIMNVMPIGLAAFFSLFPSGLVLYYVVSNAFTIVQQYVITRRLDREGLGKR